MSKHRRGEPGPNELLTDAEDRIFGPPDEGAGMTLTFRQRLERIRDRHEHSRPGPGWQSRADAVAMLKALDEATLMHEPELHPVPYRLVDDPAPPTENT